MLLNYLNNNTLYLFQTNTKSELLKSYELKGNPTEKGSKYYFKLDVLKNDGTLDKAINRVGLGGLFFEHMSMFQTPENKKYIGNGLKIWGYFFMVEPYENFKNKVTSLIKLDIDNNIPEDYLIK